MTTATIKAEANSNGTRGYAIARWTDDFKCYEYVDRTGMEYTLHAEKTNNYLTIERAQFSLRQWFNDNNHTIVPFPKPLTFADL